jgi:hypothetical protein
MNQQVQCTQEIVDSTELARRWCVPETWVRDQVRRRVADPIPHVRLGKYIRFEWGGEALVAWWARRRMGSRQATHGRMVNGANVQ